MHKSVFEEISHILHNNSFSMKSYNALICKDSSNVSDKIGAM